MHWEARRLYTWQGYDLQIERDADQGVTVRIFPHDSNNYPIAELALARASFLDGRTAGANWLADRGLTAGPVAFGPALRASYLNACATVEHSIACCIAHYGYDVDPRLNHPAAPDPAMPRERRYYVAREQADPTLFPFFRVEGPTATPAEDSAAIRASFPHWEIRALIAVAPDGNLTECPPVAALNR